MLSRAAPASRHFANTRIAPHDQITGVKCTCLEVMGVNREQPPAADVLAHHPDWTGVWEVCAEALLMFWRNGQPDAIRFRIRRAISKDENDLWPYVNRQSAEHGARCRVHPLNRLKNEPVGQ